VIPNGLNIGQILKLSAETPYCREEHNLGGVSCQVFLLIHLFVSVVLVSVKDPFICFWMQTVDNISSISNLLDLLCNYFPVDITFHSFHELGQVFCHDLNRRNAIFSVSFPVSCNGTL
jgi:hypothetical protein